MAVPADRAKVLAQAGAVAVQVVIQVQVAEVVMERMLVYQKADNPLLRGAVAVAVAPQEFVQAPAILILPAAVEA
jgi:hypothetical protein